LSRVSILLVDDKPANLLALEAILQDLGHNLVKARSGEEALQHLRREEFALVLLDVQMPEIDGFQTASMIRSQEGMRHTPIILLTAFEGDRATVERAYALGAIDFLVKPLVPVVVRAKVMGFVQLFAAAQEIKRQAEQIREMERRQFDQKLAEERSRVEWELADFFENATLGLHWVGPDGIILRANRAEFELLGYSREEYIGRNIAEFHTDESVIVDILRRLQAGEQLCEFEARLRCKDGSTRHVVISSNVLWRDGRFVHTRCFTRDVTEQRLADEALRDSEQRFARFMQHLPGLAWVKDLDGRYVFANDAAVKAFRKPRTELLGKTDEEVFPREVAAQFRENDRRALESGTGIQFVEELEHEDGVHYSVVSKFPIPGKDGRAQLIGGMAIDITEQRRAENEVRFQAHLLDSVGQAAVVVDPEGRITYWNRFAESLYEWTKDDALGRNAVELLLAPSEMARAPDIMARLRAGESWSGELLVRRRDGTTFPVYVTNTPIFDEHGAITANIGISTDITERKQAEDALRESEQRYRRLFSSIDEGFCVIEVIFDGDTAVDYRFLEVNPAFEKHTGLRDALGRTIREMAPAHEAHWFEIYGKVARTGAPVRFVNVATALGRWFDVYAFPLGRDNKVAVVFNDISARLRAEEEREHLVEQLRDADRKKDDFIALLAHELRNPLAPIRNGLQVVRISDERDVRRSALEMMERQLHHMVRLIDDLLDVSRISRNKMELRRTRVSIAEVVTSAVETAQPLIEAAGHELTVSMPGAPVYLDADLTRLAQVISNLLTNSAKYTQTGGRIWLTAERSSGSLAVSVRDDGIGIPAASLPSIFDMFSQVDRSVERNTGGLGIGLALTRGLVEMHGGTVTAESEGEGKGSTFTVTLPIAPEKHEAADESPENTHARRPPKRILVVDDHRDGAESLAVMLRLLGDEVATAHDGLEAVERAEAFRPDVILMDIGMPRLNGLAATRRIREQAWGRAVTIIALTGWGQENDRARSREAGCDGHLVKPVNLPDLEKALCNVSER
jgi:PAS domain S-box-containing protein